MWRAVGIEKYFFLILYLEWLGKMNFMGCVGIFR